MLRPLLILCFSILILNCSNSSDEGVDEEVTPPSENSSCPADTGNSPTGNNDVLIWADEFNEDGSPCSKNWTYNVGNNGWGNNEKQYYKFNDPDNVIVEDGLLKITAKRENYRGAEFTSTRMLTQDKFSFVYGKVEVRAKLPDAGGTWPAIWMLGDNISTVGWPACGEIDIMEHVGNRPGSTSSAIHNNAGYGGNYFGNEQYTETATSEFHVYGILWDKDKIEFSIDGDVHFTYNPAEKDINNWPYDAKQFIILNIAVGGTLGGAIDPNFTESSMEIDYVRVYQ